MVVRDLGIRVQSESYASLERAAAMARRRLGYTASEAIDGEHLFERMERLVVPHPNLRIEVVMSIQTVGPQREAASMYFAPGVLEVRISEETYRDLVNQAGRANFTLAHELGHVWMHAHHLHNPALIVDGLARSRRERHPIYRDAEWQADTFASAFLMPAPAVADMLDNFGDIWEVEETFGVSHAAAERRLQVVYGRKSELIRASRSVWQQKGAAMG